MTALAFPARNVRAIRAALTAVAAALAVASGRLLGLAGRAALFVPGVAGAAGVSVCTGEIASHVFGHGLAPWVGGFVGALFCLRIDGQVILRRGRE